MPTYEKQAEQTAKNLGIKLTVKSKESKYHWNDDDAKRWVFKLRLSRGRKSYTFDFGQSIAAGEKEPTMYDVLSCLQKYEIGSFEEFCGDFGYDEDSRSAEKTYKAVSKEYEAMSRMFTESELQEIQ